MMQEIELEFPVPCFDEYSTTAYVNVPDIIKELKRQGITVATFVWALEVAEVEA